MPSSLLPIAVLAMAAWAIIYAAVLVATRARIPAQSASSSTRGELSPAIVALLGASDGKVGQQAVTATFVDLIARGFIKRSTALAAGRVEIEPVDLDRSALTPYELQLLDHVTARARLGGGVVLEAALRLESSDHAARWTNGFSQKVIADAQARGLMEERTSRRARLWLWFGLIAALVLLAIAAIGFFYALIAFLVLAPLMKPLYGRRPTAAATRLVPIYRGLAAQRDAGLADLVLPIDRKRAYAAALGVGDDAWHSPLAHQDSHRVWSNGSGEWREVQVTDALSVFQGSDPVAALYAIPGALVFFGIWAWLLRDFTMHPSRWSIPMIVLAAGWAIFALLNFFVWRFVYRGLYDLNAPAVRQEGQVIYLEVRDGGSEDGGKTYYMAMDDGRSRKAVKQEIDQRLFEQLRYGDRLRLEVTPKLRCVRSTTVIPAQSPS